MISLLRPVLCLLLLGGLSAGLAADELDAVREVQAFLQRNELPEAEQELAAKLEQFPDSARVNSLHMNFAYAYRRGGAHAEALRHMQELVAYYVRATDDDAALYDQMANAMAAMSSYSRVAQKADEARQMFDVTLELLARRWSEKQGPEQERVLEAIHDVRLALIEFLIAVEEYEAAHAKLEDELRLAKLEYEQKSDSPDYILRLANALAARVVLREARGDDGLADARTRQLTFLMTKAEQFKDNPEIVGACLTAHLAAVTSLSRSDPAEAERLLGRTKTFVKSLDADNRDIQQRILISQRSFPYLEETIQSGKRHVRLVGRPAVPFDFAGWANGDSLTDDDVSGKVVLLDFWAVWCVPCVESFPHLNRWHEKYADQGLQVIGVTRFYNYSWDEAKQQPIKLAEKDLPQEQELAMLDKYAENLKLTYPFAVSTPGSEFQKQYAVQTIPQTVLIDRSGKVRMIRVGTGATVAREIERTIEKLLAEKPAAVSRK